MPKKIKKVLIHIHIDIQNYLKERKTKRKKGGGGGRPQLVTRWALMKRPAVA